jgi:hypothetical protein
LIKVSGHGSNKPALIEFSIFSVGADSPTSGGVAMMTYFVLDTKIFNGGQGPCVGGGGGGGRAGCIIKDFGVPSMFPIMFLKFSMCSPHGTDLFTYLPPFTLCVKVTGTH